MYCSLPKVLAKKLLPINNNLRSLPGGIQTDGGGGSQGRLLNTSCTAAGIEPAPTCHALSWGSNLRPLVWCVGMRIAMYVL